MKNSFVVACALSAIVYSCGETTTTDTKKDTGAATSTKPEEKPWVMPDSATSAKNWAAYMEVGPMQKMMAEWDGQWDGKVKMYMKPDAPPDSSTTVSINKMIMGGRYQQSTHTGNMMGMPFEGLSTLAYDNAKKLFINTWIDNMGTGIMHLEGRFDESTKTVILTGKCVAADMGDGTEMTVRQTYQIIDKDHHKMEMYMVPPGAPEMKTMEITYTRKK